MKGKLRPGEPRQCPGSQNAGDVVLGFTGHSRKDRSARPHAAAPTHPGPCSGKQLCQAHDTRKWGPSPLGVSEQGVGWLIRESSKMMFKNKWLLTKMEKVCSSAALLISRTTELGMHCLFGATISVSCY